MGQIFAYSVGVSLVMLLLYPAYKWLMAAEKQASFNRVVLLVIYLLSFLMPFFAGLMAYGDRTLQGASDLLPLTVETGEIVSAAGGTSSLMRWFIGAYAAGALLVLIHVCVTAIRLHRIVIGGKRIACRGYTKVISARQNCAPFSWGRFVVMPDGCDAGDAAMIERHEVAHVARRHYLDLILSQMACVVMWYNPVVWLMQSELKAVHEYEADAEVIRGGCDIQDYQRLLIRKTVGQRFPSLANSLNHSKLKKRITMMYSKKSSVARRYRALALVPAAALGLLLLNVPAVSGAMALASDTAMDSGSPTESKVTTKSSVVQNNASKTHVAANKLPEFRGGQDAMFAYLIKDMKYPKAAEEAQEQGLVVVGFTIAADGSVTDVSVDRSVSESLDAEAVRLVKGTNGMWTPGEENGKKIACRYTLPVTFKLK